MLPNVNVNFETMDLEDEIDDVVLDIIFGHKTRHEAVKELLNLHSVSESYIKCWNCKQFEQTGTNTIGNEVGNCKLNDCKVSHPKWQKCGEYEQCGNFR